MGCDRCKGFVSEKQYEYSIENYGKILCMDCQKYYPNLKAKHEKRKERSTPQAIKLYEALMKLGFNAKLEQYDGYKHIDIAIPDHKVNIEVDGMQHQYDEKQAIADLKRTFYSFKKNYVTLRIPNKLIDEKCYETAKYIKEFLEASPEQLEK